jgi:hypothetical protein
MERVAREPHFCYDEFRRVGRVLGGLRRRCSPKQKSAHYNKQRENREQFIFMRLGVFLNYREARINEEQETRLWSIPK